jgi:hypothetical protein
MADRQNAPGDQLRGRKDALVATCCASGLPRLQRRTFVEVTV